MIRYRYTLEHETLEIRAATESEAWARLREIRPGVPVFRTDRMALVDRPVRLGHVLGNERGAGYVDAILTLAATGFAGAVWAIVAALLVAW
jgi:hypothetical protein